MTPGGDGGAIPDIVQLLYLLGTLAILLSTLLCSLLKLRMQITQKGNRFP